MSEKHTCPECGKDHFKSAHALACHRAKAHGVRGKNVHANKKKAGRAGGRKKAARPARPLKRLRIDARLKVDPESISAAFALVGVALIESGQIAEQCVVGLADLLGKVHALRDAYIRKSKELEKLQVEIVRLRHPEVARP